MGKTVYNLSSSSGGMADAADLKSADEESWGFESPLEHSGYSDEVVGEDVVERMLVCRQCQREFPHPATRGRPPIFCGPECREGARAESLRADRDARDSTPESPYVTAYFETLRNNIRY